jgi:hypothetical protein
MRILLLVAFSLSLCAQSTEDLAALDAINAVLSATTSGVTFLAFSDRVLDARAKADHVPTLGPQLKLALEYYEVSSQTWSLRIGPCCPSFPALNRDRPETGWRAVQEN